MALSPNQRIISADDHMDLHVLPPEVFQGRLPRGLRGRGPKVVDTDDGLFWEVEGRLLSPSGRKGKGLLHGQQHGFRPGQPDTRLEDMDRDGVYAHVIYSPMTTQLRLQDPVLRAACMIAYNDWVAEFCRANPDRLVPLASVPASSPREARDELLRVAKLGLRGAIVSQFEGSEPLFEDAWHPFWDAAEEVGLPINVHLDSGTARYLALPGAGGGDPDAARRDPRRHDLLGNPRAASAGPLRHGGSRSRLDPLRDRAAGARARQLRERDRRPQARDGSSASK
jgi:hypothetical protein